MSPEDHVKKIIAELVIQIAKLSAENDDLKAKLLMTETDGRQV